MLNWSGGTAPFQVQLRADPSAAWQDVAGITYRSSQTNIVTQPAAFYRVASVASVIASSPDKTPPSVPMGLAASAAGANQINLTWAASTDTGASATGVKGYNVYRDGVFLKQVPAAATSTTDTHVAPSTTYSYSVSAMDNAYNESAQTSPAGATTPATGSCMFTLSPQSASATAAGLSGSITVGAASGCGWTASSSAPWITITAGSGGTGSGTVSYSVAANTGTTGRTNTITVAGQTFTVTQSGPACSYSISPNSVSLNALGGTGNVTVNGGSGCAWTASSGAAWLTVTAGASGSGNGTVSYSVATNFSTSTLTGTLTIAGQAFTVTVAADPPPTVALTAPATGATVSGTIALTATASDGVLGVVKVEFYCDGSTLLGTATTAPYGASCNTTTMANGSHSFTAKAYDAAGNSTVSAPSTVTVSNTVTSTPGQLQWVKTMLTVSPIDVANCWSVVADTSANAIIAGDFNQTINFGSGAISSTVLGNYDGYVAKYSAQGTLAWSKTFGGTGNDGAKSVTVDSAGNVIVAGYFSTTANFGGQSLTAPDPNHLGVADMFVAKYSPSGSLIWAKQFGGSMPDYATAVAVDGSDNIFFAGWFESLDANFGGVTLNAGGNINFAIAKLSPSGTTVWAKSFGGTLAQAYGLAVDKSGDVAVTGRFSGSTDFGAGVLTAFGQYTAFVAKYSGLDGTCRWAKAFGGSSGANQGQSVTTDPITGNVIVTGGFTGTANFGGGSVSSGSGEAVFLVGYDASGNFLWVNIYGGSMAGDTDQGNAVRIDGSGHLVLSGLKSTPWTIGTTWYMNSGFFVMSYSISGNTAPTLRWIKVPGSGTGGSTATAATLDGSGHVLLGGSFNTGTVNFGGISATSPTGAVSGFLGQYSN